MNEIYMYGMVLSTNSFLLSGDFPKADGYCEFKKRYHLLGGETGTAAAILTSLGCRLTLAGSHLGAQNNSLVRNYFDGKSVDMSEIVYDENFSGVEDYVMIAGSTRTCFGEFGKLFSESDSWYEKPSEASVEKCSCVGADPFLGDEIANLCIKHKKKLATIDSRHDSLMCKACEVIAISHEYLDGNYPDKTCDELYKMYTDSTDGLVIFTFGEKPVVYGRKGQPAKSFPAYKVNVESTLGAGDSFKAGTIYAMNKGMTDDEIVKFACATAACACCSFPIPLNPPTLEKIENIMG